MSKAVISFNLKDIEEEQDFKRYVKSKDMALAIWDILNVRKALERKFESHNDDDIHLDVFDGVNDFAKEISDILDNYSIDIDELIN
jgi:hypothetical protein